MKRNLFLIFTILFIVFLSSCSKNEDITCIAKDCSELKIDCGTVKDNCGNMLDCGKCPSGSKDNVGNAIVPMDIIENAVRNKLK